MSSSAESLSCTIHGVMYVQVGWMGFDGVFTHMQVATRLSGGVAIYLAADV
jgi:hypothetical protein